MIHYVVNTGDTMELQATDFDPAVIDTLRPLIAQGGLLPGESSPFYIQVVHHQGGCMFSVLCDKVPICVNGLAWTPAGATGVWSEIEHLYLDVSDQHSEFMGAGEIPECPASLPWLSVIQMPHMTMHSELDLCWLDEFGSSLAFAILQEKGGF